MIAITREVSAGFAACELSFVARSPIDVARARVQHHAYEDALPALGCVVESMVQQPGLADSVFVEDTAPCAQQISVYNGSCYDQSGCYDVWVTDANGCTSSQQVTIAGVKINDNGNCGMYADMCGGCAPYKYVWSNGASSQCITCLSTGTYTVTVTDCNGATYTCSKSIVVNPLTEQLIGPQPGTNTIDNVVQGGCLPFTCTYDINSGAQQSLPQSLNPITTFKFPNYVSNDFYRVYISDFCGNIIPTFQFFAREGVNGAVSKQYADSGVDA